jgi:hypothetical protein
MIEKWHLLALSYPTISLRMLVQRTDYLMKEPKLRDIVRAELAEQEMYSHAPPLTPRKP